MTVAALTLGCKVNQYDTDAILQDFCDLGFTICDFDTHTDIYIVNTCTVTNISDKKSRQMINRAHRQNPNALIVAYGCYAQVEPETLKNIPGVSMVLGTKDKHQVAEIVASLFDKTEAVPSKPPAKRTRAYLKVQDGCDRYCAYCIVPYARGSVVSRSIEDAAAEAEDIVQSGCKEIVLTGIQIASYGNDLKKLMKHIHDIPGLERLRLGSLEPNIIDEEFLQTASSLPKLCDHFHLSLQSGCDRILKRMNRRYNTAQFAIAVKGIHSYFPKATLTTDIIVGFPGETEEDFEETLVFAEKIGFFRIHVFAYSPKAGTPAAGFPDQVDIKVKEHRSCILRNLAKRMNRSFYRQYIGETLPVLFESESDGIWEGHTTQYLTVKAPYTQNLSNRIVTVRLTKEQNGTACGEIIIGGT